jgi:hypothetical protein
MLCFFYQSENETLKSDLQKVSTELENEIQQNQVRYRNSNKAHYVPITLGSIGEEEEDTGLC